MKHKTCIIISIASVLAPLLSICLSIALSGWFDLWENALSDLGHPTKSGISPIFNLGLSLGGLLIAVSACKCLHSVNRLFGVLLFAAGYSLILVAVFNEAYGYLHFIASVVFFVLILLFSILYATKLRNKYFTALVLWLVILSATTWTLHFTFRTPKGAAVPELISIAIVIPIYFHLIISSAMSSSERLL
ncbi:MAG: DUF998 domain-containing protein [Desulfurococcaceae archaeon]